MSLSLSPPATSKGVRVAACLEGVLDSYARRAQAGGVTVSQQKHLICPASQRLPAVIVQPAYCHPGLYYCTLSRSAYHYSLLSNNSSLIWCAAFTVVADPIRRPRLQSAHPAFRLLVQKLLPPTASPPLTYPLNSPGRPRAGHRSYCSLDDIISWPLLGLITKSCARLVSPTLQLTSATAPPTPTNIHSCKPRIIRRADT